MANKGRILVVDDDRLVLATLSHGLAQAGYDVFDADNGDDAILLAREHRPDLALLDIRMEGMSGFDVATYLRDYCQMPFMFLSAFSDDATIRHVKQLGAVAYLVKPLDIKQIVPAVEAAFADIALHRGRAPAAPTSPVVPPASQDQTAGSLLPKDDVLDPVVAMAIGVLMHRYSLSRSAARARLQRMAAAESRTTGALAERLLAAIELLAAGG